MNYAVVSLVTLLLCVTCAVSDFSMDLDESQPKEEISDSGESDEISDSNESDEISESDSDESDDSKVCVSYL
jgi:hypothetical protein